jgi:hypothetical protein
VRQVVLPLLPGLEEEVDGSGHHEQEAVGDDIAGWKITQVTYVYEKAPEAGSR